MRLTTPRPGAPAPATSAGAGAQASAEVAERDVPVLALRQATIGYGSRPVVLSADLEVSRGQSVALLGANGAGKTTLVRGLLGLADILAGEVAIVGRPVRGRERRRRIGYVPQRLAPAAGVPTTASEVVGSGLLAGGGHWWPGQGGRRAVAAALDEVGLGEAARVPVSELSGGQHRRVLIARALVSDPEILLLDEPTAGVDRTSVRSLVATMTGMRTAGRTMLVVTHELDEVADVVDRVVSLVDGTLIEGPAPGHPVGGH